MNEKEPLGLAWGVVNEHRFERIISLAHWGGWECTELGYHTKGTIEQFAEIVGHRVPERFNWVEVLKPEYEPGADYVLFNPKSVEHWRTLPPDQADRVHRELVMKHGCVVRMEGNECDTVDELFALVYNAAMVVTVEGGVSNIAGAFDRNTVVLSGMTDVWATMDQYVAHHGGDNTVELRGATIEGCDAPCYRQASKGFKNGKCCGDSDEPLCLARLDIDLIAEATEHFTTLQETD